MGPTFTANAAAWGLEGVVSKRRDAPYIPGRGHGWLKIKCAAREEFAIIGWTDPVGSREGFGSLLLGYYDTQGSLHYAGRVGTGFTRAVLHDLGNRLEQLTVNTAPAAEIAAAVPKRSHWVKPDLVAEVRFTEWTQDRRLRHPVFLGLREDKRGRDASSIQRLARCSIRPPARARCRRASSNIRRCAREDARQNLIREAARSVRRAAGAAGPWVSAWWGLAAEAVPAR